MIELTLLGRPKIKRDGTVAELPFKQAEAILYYLVIHGEVSRLTLADIIWGDKYDSEKMRANMRNATYILRKTFGEGFFAKSSRDCIAISPSCHIKTDLNDFLKSPQLSPSLYTGDFLEDFHLKDNEFYNEWVEGTREKYRSIYIESLKTHIAKGIESNNPQSCLPLCHKLIACNEFDETGYKYLIEIYKDSKDYSNAMAVYKKLERLLTEELFEAPCQELVSIAQEVRSARSREFASIINRKSCVENALDSRAAFYGRAQELELITEPLLTFAANKRGTSIAIMGEAGVGKSKLAEVVLATMSVDELFILKTRCYRAEENYILKPWQLIFEQLIDSMGSISDSPQSKDFLNFVFAYFPYLRRNVTNSIDIDEISPAHDSNAEKVITSALIMLSKERKMILYFDDIQWADEVSISLIRNIITIDQNRNIVFILACREDVYEYCERFIEDTTLSNLLKKVPLGSFNYKETTDLARMLLPEFHFDESICTQLYHETEGNPFFLVETLNNFKYNGSLMDITPNIRDVIKNRINCLTPESRKMLELMSIFFDGAPLDMLLELISKSQYELVEIVEYLISKKIIREETYLDSVLFHFTHQKILEYVYNEMSIAKKMILHNKVGTAYEDRLQKAPYNLPIYSKLIYHFEKGKNQSKHFKYILKYVYSYLNTAHEYYPVLENKDNGRDGPSNVLTDMGGVDHTLGRISEMIAQTIDEHMDGESLDMLSDYYHMMGRYSIRKVDYNEGLHYINLLKSLISDYSQPAQCQNLIKANRQLMCVYINRCEIENMRETIEESFKILKHINVKEETAIWERLAGLCCIMSGETDNGIKNLEKAISAFEGSKDRDMYLFNLAASYAWLGEAQRNLKNYVRAQTYYDKAISICNSNYLVGGISTFYTYAGLAAYDSGDVTLAEKRLKEAICYYENVELMWGRGMAYSYYALVMLELGEYESTLALLEKAAGYADRLDSRYEKGVLNRIYAQIKAKMEYTPNLSAVFQDVLTQPKAQYVQCARKLLKGICSPIDIEYLDRL